MKANAGFTIIEFMIALVIVALLLSIGTPSYRYVTTANRIAGEVNGLLGDLQLARGQAMKQGLPVTVCASNDNATCTGGTSWAQGWITYIDLNQNNAQDSAETPMKIQKKFSGSDTFNATNSVSSITFNRQGIAAGIANGTMFKLQDPTGNNKWTRCLIVTMTGLASSQSYGGTFNGVSCT